METREVGHYTEILNCYIHTTFDLTEDDNTFRRFQLDLLKIPGVDAVKINRYAITVQVAFLFDADKVRTAVLPVVEQYFKPDKIRRIQMQDIVNRAVEQQLRMKEELETSGLTGLLAQMTNIPKEA